MQPTSVLRQTPLREERLVSTLAGVALEYAEEGRGVGVLRINVGVLGCYVKKYWGVKKCGGVGTCWGVMLSRVGVLGCWGDGAAGVALEYAEKCLDIAGKYYVKEHPEFLNYRGNYGVVLKAQVSQRACPEKAMR
eukprot:738309-Prorocentrum_minimum.AAC.9